MKGAARISLSDTLEGYRHGERQTLKANQSQAARTLRTWVYHELQVTPMLIILQSNHEEFLSRRVGAPSLPPRSLLFSLCRLRCRIIRGQTPPLSPMDAGSTQLQLPTLCSHAVSLSDEAPQELGRPISLFWNRMHSCVRPLNRSKKEELQRFEGSKPRGCG